ncbi:MAG: hypothetical protein U1E05_06695 [Patescibacteria group bacterium]|nr:hypothetical protein [Patescibacteria group bacterium]
MYSLLLYPERLWCTLLVGALIEYDAHQVKWRVYVPALAIGIIAGIAAPVLHTVPVWGGVEGWFVGALNVAAGLAAGGLFGWLLSRWEPATRRNGVGLGLACTGLILGWQAVVGLAVATLLWQAAAAMVGRRLAIMRSVPTSLVLVGLTFVWLVAWAVVWAMLAPWLPGV